MKNKRKSAKMPMSGKTGMKSYGNKGKSSGKKTYYGGKKKG